jgi:hypothetical protein
MPEMSVLLITGLLREFQAALVYLQENDAYSKYQVILSTWETQIEENSGELKTFEKSGGRVITTPAINLGRHTSVASQHLSLSRGLVPEISNSTTVIKTRTDWMVEHKLLNDVNKIILDTKKPRLFTSGFIPSSPYFFPDGHFVSSARNLRMISNLDLVDILRFSYLHPEQNFFLPNNGQRSSALEMWLTLDIGTQFDKLATSQWMKVRLKSKLFYYVIGEYFKWVHENTGPIKFDKLEINKLEINEFLFGCRSDRSSRRTRLILRNHIDVNLLRKLSFPNQILEDYFWKGFYGDVLETEELHNLSAELEKGIKKNIVLNNVRNTIAEHNFMINSNEAKQMVYLQNEISWLRERVKTLEGTDTI